MRPMRQMYTPAFADVHGVFRPIPRDGVAHGVSARDAHDVHAVFAVDRLPCVVSSVS